MKLLKWPYPYHAGLTISNDAEYLTLRGWLTLENFFRATFGRTGLFSTSLFLVNPDSEDPAMSLYGSDGTKSNDYDQISSLITNKSIDGIHAIGNFDNADFRDYPIPQIISETAEMFSFDWWSNHGSANNQQNIGHRELENYQQGDLPNSPFYSVNYARELGINYFWFDDNALTRSKMGRFSESFTTRSLRDGSTAVTFNRFRGLAGDYAPTLASLRRQISDSTLQRLLYLKQGAVIYQHLGISQRRNKAISKVVEVESDIPESAICFFQSLAEFQKKGLWVANTSTFLNYTHAVQNLSIHESRGALVISAKFGSRVCLDYVSIITKHPIEQIYFVDAAHKMVNFTEFTNSKVKSNKYLTVLGGKRGELL